MTHVTADALPLSSGHADNNCPNLGRRSKAWGRVALKSGVLPGTLPGILYVVFRTILVFEFPPSFDVDATVVERIRSVAIAVSPRATLGTSCPVSTSSVVVSIYGSVSRLIVTTWGTNLPFSALERELGRVVREVPPNGFPDFCKDF